MTVEETRANAEAEIKRVIEGGIEAIRDKNIEGVMALYAPEVVSFDIVPPLQYVGAKAFRKAWEAVFSSFQGPIGYDIHDLGITVGEDVAFSHSLNRISGTLNTGQKTDLWLALDQRQVVGRAPSELGAGRFADWPRGAGPQALAIAWPEGRSELPQRSASSSVWGERRWRIPRLYADATRQA